MHAQPAETSRGSVVLVFSLWMSYTAVQTEQNIYKTFLKGKSEFFSCNFFLIPITEICNFLLCNFVLQKFVIFYTFYVESKLLLY